MFEKIAGMKIAQVFFDENRFDITRDECFLNGVDLVRTADHKQFPSIVAMLVSSACNMPDTEIKIKKNPQHTDFLKGLLENLNKSNQVKVRVLDSKPDEITDNKPIEAKFKLQSLEDFRDKLKVFSSCFEDTLKLSDIILKTKLPKSVRGFKNLTQIMTNTKSAAQNMETNKEQYEIVSEQIDNGIGKMMVALIRKMDGTGRNFLKTAIDQFADDFMRIKKLSSEMVCSFNPLYNIDQEFKHYTEYPATWYFEPSVFYNFTERYKDASDNLIDMARAEACIVRPLCNWNKLKSYENK